MKVSKVRRILYGLAVSYVIMPENRKASVCKKLRKLAVALDILYHAVTELDRRFRLPVVGRPLYCVDLCPLIITGIKSIVFNLCHFISPLHIMLDPDLWFLYAIILIP